jgi:hypothetical protein
LFGLVPAIHVFVAATKEDVDAAPNAGMTNDVSRTAVIFISIFNCQTAYALSHSRGTDLPE